MAVGVGAGIEGVAELFEGEGARSAAGSWDGRCRDPGLEMFKAAYHLAVQMGLGTGDIPELRTENGVLHAFTPTGRKLRLVPGPGWEEESGYADLLRSLRQRS
jgi:hypothetical protein